MGEVTGSTQDLLNRREGLDVTGWPQRLVKFGLLLPKHPTRRRWEKIQKLGVRSDGGAWEKRQGVSVLRQDWDGARWAVKDFLNFAAILGLQSSPRLGLEKHPSPLSMLTSRVWDEF